MNSSSEISNQISEIIDKTINLIYLSSQTIQNFKNKDMSNSNDVLEYLQDETNANTISLEIEEKLKNLEILFNNIETLKSRFSIINQIFNSQFRSEKTMSEEELNNYLFTQGYTPDNYSEEKFEDDGIDVDMPYPSNENFTNINPENN